MKEFIKKKAQSSMDMPFLFNPFKRSKSIWNPCEKKTLGVYTFATLIVSSNKEDFRYSDDGEPSNSAGAPIYGQIKSFDLTNILIAVVRYYGGTKLGVGGLINAYRTAAKEAIVNATISNDEDRNIFEVTFTMRLCPLL